MSEQKWVLEFDELKGTQFVSFNLTWGQICEYKFGLLYNPKACATLDTLSALAGQTESQ